MYGGRIYLEFKSLLSKKCERQCYKIACRKCCNDIDEGLTYDWKRAFRRQFLHKLIFDRNFVCDIHFMVTRNQMQMLRFQENFIAGMATKQNKQENWPTTSKKIGQQQARKLANNKMSRRKKFQTKTSVIEI